MELCTTELCATFVARSAFRWPRHSGSLLRGLLGRALRQVGCARLPEACGGACAAPEECAYARLFDPPPRRPPPHRLLTSAERPPPPFVLLIPPPGEAELALDARESREGRGPDVRARSRRDRGSGERVLAPEERVTMGVRLLGRRSADEIGRIGAALEGMAELPVGPDAGRWALCDIRQSGARNQPVAFDPPAAPPSRLRIHLETPLWLETKGRVTRNVEAVPLFRAVARRITTVCALHGALGPEHDREFAELDAAAARARVVAERPLREETWQRQPLERESPHPMRGLVGSFAVEGEVAPLFSWFRWAEKVHVGKSTSHGLGRLRVTAE